MTDRDQETPHPITVGVVSKIVDIIHSNKVKAAFSLSLRFLPIPYQK